jgi:hypothetical protein
VTGRAAHAAAARDAAGASRARARHPARAHAACLRGHAGSRERVRRALPACAARDRRSVRGGVRADALRDVYASDDEHARHGRDAGRGEPVHGALCSAVRVKIGDVRVSVGGSLCPSLLAIENETESCLA